jgi:hypothetical protein
VSMPLLVRHPAPDPTESLLGYVLRVSEGNGYSSPWSVYCLAGMKSNEMRVSGVKLEKLARITNWPQAKLDAITYSAPPDQPRWSRGVRLERTGWKANDQATALSPSTCRELRCHDFDMRALGIHRLWVEFTERRLDEACEIIAKKSPKIVRNHCSSPVKTTASVFKDFCESSRFIRNISEFIQPSCRSVGPSAKLSCSSLQA